MTPNRKTVKDTFHLFICTLLIASCSPKYGAYFQTTDSNKSRTEVALKTPTTSQAAMPEEQQKQHDTWINVTASINNEIVETPLAEIVKKHNEKLEEIQLSIINSKEATKKIKTSEKEFRKEVKAELKKSIKELKAGDGDYTLMMILGILIAPLGVGLTYNIGTDFWISLVLFLLFWLPGAIYGGIKVHQFYKG
jgi:uncharacterized membrane protein YqaE (UPF0057 family)